MPILFIVGIALIIFSVVEWVVGEDGDIRENLYRAIIGVLLVIIASMNHDSKLEPVEYPASKYTLEYKVTEYQGRKDTTYVITLSSLIREQELQSQ